MSEDKLHHARVLGARAEYLLKDELLLATFDAVRHDYVTQWMQSVGSRPDDVLSREKLWLAVNVVKDVRVKLEQMIANGKMAQRQLDEQN